MADPDQPPLTRAGELLAALTTDQKIQLALGNFAALASFGVPALNADDGPDGLRNPGTTAMPSGQALAATFDRALAYAYGQVVGSEARGEGFNEWLGPGGGHRPHAAGGPPAGGRGRGPVPGREHLGPGGPRRPGAARHRRRSSTTPPTTRTSAGSASRPMPRAQFARGSNVAVSERALQEIYEAPFRIAVQQGDLDSVMCSYNQINGLPSCQNPTTLGDLKQGDGLSGFVVPDFGFAVRDPVAAALAGVDLPALPGAAPAA